MPVDHFLGRVSQIYYGSFKAAKTNLQTIATQNHNRFLKIDAVVNVLKSE